MVGKRTPTSRELCARAPEQAHHSRPIPVHTPGHACLHTSSRPLRAQAMESLVRQEDYTLGTQRFVNTLRNVDDAKPKFITPPIDFAGARKRMCFSNVVAFCKEYPEYEEVMGFKMWVMPTFGVATTAETTPYVALAHVVARHKQTRKYVDVTPAEKGDEGQKMLFVPSSRLYPDWSAAEMDDYDAKGFRPRMGSVCKGIALAWKHLDQGPDLHKATPEELKLLFCPKLDTVRAHLGGMRLETVKALVAAMDGKICEIGETEFAIVDASKYRWVSSLTAAVHEEIEKREAS